MKDKKPIYEMLPIANELVEKFNPFCDKIEICGSIRRGREEVSEIEILCNPKKLKILIPQQFSLFKTPSYKEKPIPDFMEFVKQFKGVRGTLNRGKLVSFETLDGIPVNVFTGDRFNYGFTKVLRTGPYDYYMKFILPRLKNCGYEIENGYILADGMVIPTPEEEDVYRLMKSEFHPPDKRDQFLGYFN